VSDDHHKILSTVDEFVDALSVGDTAGLRALFTDDAVIWHNYDQVGQPAMEAISALAPLAALQPRYEITGRDVVDGACIQRHVVHLTLPGGESAAIPAIQRIAVTDGRIRRIDEYMDSGQVAAVVQAMQDSPPIDGTVPLLPTTR
jgi:ketosteroid isomerase-like protein